MIDFIKERNIKTATELAEILSTELGIKCKQEDDLFTFNYDQINSPKTHPLVRQCRGIVMTEDLQVVARTPERFFNLGEALEITDAFEWNQPFEVREKADGSFIKIYYANGRWEVGTRGTARAEVENYAGKQFRAMALEALGFYHEQDFQDSAKNFFWDDCTYCFELISPYNRVVTPYSETEMVLLAVIVTESGKELDDLSLNMRLPKVYKATNREDLVALANSLEGLQEGFVIKDVNGLRIKVKSEVYVAVHKLRGVLSPKNIAELVVTNETDEYLAYFPEDLETFQPYITKYEELISTGNELYNQVKNIENQKEFAMAVKNHPLSSAMFQARKFNKDIKVTSTILLGAMNE